MLFENELNHVGKNLTGMELTNSPAHDEIIMIRTVEIDAKAIISDPKILHPCKFDKKKMLHIYDKYCATRCTEERNEKGEVIDLPNVSVSLIGEAVNLAFLHA